MTDHTEFEAIDVLDTRILGAAREVYDRLDPVPADLVERCRFALTVQALHAEVAVLTSGSPDVVALTRSTGKLAGTTGTSGTETVTFTASHLSLMVTVTPDAEDDRVRLDGWVTDGGSRVEVRGGRETRVVVADAEGRLALEGVARGRTYFVVWSSSGTDQPVVTPAVDL